MTWGPRIAVRVVRRAGRRGAFLAFLAVLDSGYGYSLLATSAPQRHLDLILPWQWWGAIWIAVAAASLTGAFCLRDWWAFGVATLLKTAWAAVMADAWLLQGVPRGGVPVVVWACFALTVLVVSGWPDPVRR